MHDAKWYPIRGQVRNLAEQDAIIEEAVKAAQGFGPGKRTTFTLDDVIEVARRAAFHGLRLGGCLTEMARREAAHRDAEVDAENQRHDAWKRAQRRTA